MLCSGREVKKKRKRGRQERWIEGGKEGWKEGRSGSTIGEELKLLLREGINEEMRVE